MTIEPIPESITSRSTHARPRFIQSASSILHLNDHVTTLSDFVYAKVELVTSVSLLVLAGKLLIQWRKSVNSIEDIPRFLEVYDIMGIFPSLFIAAVRKTMKVHPKTEKRKWKNNSTALRFYSKFDEMDQQIIKTTAELYSSNIKLSNYDIKRFSLKIKISHYFEW